MSSLIVPRRFNGPSGSGNGGWTAGALAARLPAERDKPVQVRLSAPPPLDTPMQITETANGAVATHQGRPVAAASYAETDPLPVPPTSPAVAARAEARYAGHVHHPFPTCFTCGTARRSDDGLRIFAGPIGTDRVAATWTPYEISIPITWAALDCPGAWASDLTERTIVLGEMTARIHTMPTTAERYVVVGALRGDDGRKVFTATTLYGPGGDVVAVAEHVWISVDRDAFG